MHGFKYFKKPPQRFFRIPQLFHMGYIATDLGTKTKTGRNFTHPFFYSLWFGQVVKTGVDFSCFKKSGIIFQPIRGFKLGRIKYIFPMLIAPARRSYMQFQWHIPNYILKKYANTTLACLMPSIIL